VIAIVKPGKDPSLAANYRPVSLLSVHYKLLERLALQRISPTVEGLLSPDQVAFRKGRSTCDQVAAITTFIENGFQQYLKTAAIFLDLTAAYDTVGHTGLLYKLSKVCHFVLLDNDESCLTADRSNIDRPNGQVYWTGELLDTTQSILGRLNGQGCWTGELSDTTQSNIGRPNGQAVRPVSCRTRPSLT